MYRGEGWRVVCTQSGASPSQKNVELGEDFREGILGGEEGLISHYKVNK